MTSYSLVSTVLFLLLAVTWKSDSILNMILKVLFTCMSVWGLVCTFVNLGLVVQLPGHVRLF